MKEAVKIKVIMLITVIAAMLFSCSDEQKAEREAKKLADERQDKVEQVADRWRDSVEMVMDATLDEIDKRISLIKNQSGYIAINTGSDLKGKGKKEQILNNIALMDELIAENEKRIGDLRNELKKVNSNNKKIKKRIAEYEEMNKSMEMEMNELRSQLGEQKTMNDKLTVDNERLNIELSNQGVVYDNLRTQYTKAEKDAYTAYLAKGSRRELKEENVLAKKTILTFAGPNKINPDASSENFEKIDTRTTLQIPLGTKDAKIVTTHSENSYKWCDDPDGTKKLCIVDPQVFWEKSKYLVIETK